MVDVESRSNRYVYAQLQNRSCYTNIFLGGGGLQEKEWGKSRFTVYRTIFVIVDGSDYCQLESGS